MNTLEAERKVVKKHRNICNLRAYDYYLRGEVCTRVYTTVYLRVHKSVYDRSSSSPTLGGTEGDR